MVSSPSKIEKAVLNFARMRLEYFDCIVSIGSPTEEALERSATGVAQAFAQQFHSITSVSYETGLALFSMVQESKLADSTIQALVSLIQSNVSACVTINETGTEGKQECAHFHEYPL